MSKQVIVMRTDLKKMQPNKQPGKVLSQGAHASIGAVFQMMNGGKSVREYTPEIKDNKYTLSLEVEVGSDVDNWIRGIFTKIALAVNSEEELIEIYNKALEKGLPAVLIEDAGNTLFNGVKTITCVGIGPANSDVINEITGHLPLLK